MPGKRVFLRTNAVNTVFPQNEKLLFSNEKLTLTALSRAFRAGTGPIPMRFFLRASIGTIEMPGERVFLRTNAEKPFSPQNEKLLFSNERTYSNRPFPRFSSRNRTYSDAFFHPASIGTIEMPGKRAFLRTNAVIPFFPQNEKKVFSNE